MKNKNIGSTFDRFLKEEKIFEEVEAKALKRVISLFIEQQLKKDHITKTELAKKMHTSRAAVNRLLDPKNTSVTLNSIVKVMVVLDKKLQVIIS